MELLTEVAVLEVLAVLVLVTREKIRSRRVE